MANGPESGSLLQKACLLGEDIFSEELKMIALPQVVCTCLSLDKFTIKVNRILDCLVLDRQDLDPLDDLIKEELGQDVVRGNAFLS